MRSQIPDRPTPVGQDADDLNSVVIRNVKILIALRGLTGYNALAEAMSLDPSAISMKMRGVRRWSLADVERLAVVLRVEVPVLFMQDTAALVAAS